MIKIIFCVLSIFSNIAFAETGFSQVEKLFNEGALLDIGALKSVDQGMYVGRCFNTITNYPYGAATGFKNFSQDSGPIPVDPELFIGFNWAQQSDYFDKVNVRSFLEKMYLKKSEKSEHEDSYEVYNQNWYLQFRQNGRYIIQKNTVNGFEDSYCYYYSFRLK